MGKKNIDKSKILSSLNKGIRQPSNEKIEKLVIKEKDRIQFDAAGKTQIPSDADDDEYEVEDLIDDIPDDDEEEDDSEDDEEEDEPKAVTAKKKVKPEAAPKKDVKQLLVDFIKVSTAVLAWKRAQAYAELLCPQEIPTIIAKIGSLEAQQINIAADIHNEEVFNFLDAGAQRRANQNAKK